MLIFLAIPERIRYNKSMTHADDYNTDRHLVFVYGSLKQGYGNYRHFLTRSEFVGPAVTVEPVYTLISLGGFPGVLKDGENAIFGEVYRVDDRVFQSLDHLESNGSMYQREQIQVAGQDGEVHLAWIYIFLGSPWTRRRNLYESVEFLETDAGFLVQNWVNHSTSLFFAMVRTIRRGYIFFAAKRDAEAGALQKVTVV